MNAVVMGEPDIGEQTIVAASAFIRAGMKIPPRLLVSTARLQTKALFPRKSASA